MILVHRIFAILCSAILLVSLLPTVDGQYGQQSTHDEFQVIFHQPDDDELLEYYEWIKSASGYENDAKIFSNLFKFPASASTKTITIHFQDCNGISNAFYSPSESGVAICYELVKDILSAYNIIDNLEPTIKPDKATLNTVRGILYHELGHALVDVFDLDVLGQEEDAVDGFATIMLIQFKEYQAIIDAAILGYYYGNYQIVNLQFVFYNEHSFTLERVHNIVCLLYGSDTKQFASLKGSYLLPEQRAIRCPHEYDQAKKSWDNQLSPFIAKTEKETPERQTQMPVVYGEIIFDKDSYSSNEYAIISILDPDENKNPQTTESVIVRLSSTTDPIGISVRFPETSPNTGIFEDEITLTSVGISSATTLRVSASDTITVRYLDQTIPSGGTAELLGRAFVVGMPVQEEVTISVRTQASNYGIGDTVTISGKVSSIRGDKIVDIEILNPNGRVYKVANAPLDSNGNFEWFLVILESKITVLGTYKITIRYGDSSATTTYTLTKPEVPQPTIVSAPAVKVLAKQINDLLFVRIKNTHDSNESIYGLNLSSKGSVFIACKGPKFWEVESCTADQAILFTKGLSVVGAGEKAIFKFKIKPMKDELFLSWFVYDHNRNILDKSSVKTISKSN